MIVWYLFWSFEMVLSRESKDSYSFYGLWHWLSEANQLLDQIDSISLSKAPKTQVGVGDVPLGC